jgi:uncharacterized repeat protein (TIGR01451 family)
MIVRVNLGGEKMKHSGLTKLISCLIIMVLAMVHFDVLFSGVVQAVTENKPDLQNEEIKEQLEGELTQEMDKLLPIDEKTVLWQQSVTISMKAKEQTLETEMLTVSLPKWENHNLKELTVLREGKPIDKSQYQISSDTGMLIIAYLSMAEEVSIDFTHHFEIIGTYEGDFTFSQEKQTISVETKIKAKEQENVWQKSIQNEYSLEEKGELVSLTGESKPELSKGYWYAKSEKTITIPEIIHLGISNVQDLSEMKLTIGKGYFQNEEEKQEEQKTGITYRQTKINKAEMLRILGPEGTIQIFDQDEKELARIGAGTIENEEGEIVISYDTPITRLTFAISIPQTLGTLTLTNDKTTQGDLGYEPEQMQNWTMWKQEAKLQLNEKEQTLTTQTTLKEPEASMDFQVSRQEFSSAVEEQEWEMNVILQAKQETEELFCNPTIFITLPEEFEQIEVESIHLLYQNEFTITEAKLRGNQIQLQLQGEQTTYSSETEEQPTLRLQLKTSLNPMTTSGNKELKLEYQNQNKKTVDFSKQIPLGTSSPVKIITKSIIVSVPEQIVTKNTVEDTEVFGVGEGIETILLEKSAPKKQTKVNIELVNTRSVAEQVEVLGRFPTKGQFKLGEAKRENTIEIQVLSEIELQAGPQARVNIYYSENEAANNNLQDPSNGWQEQISDLSKVKSYLIITSKLQVGEKIQASYTISIPAGLAYNESAFQSYEVSFKEVDTGASHVAKAKLIAMETGVGPVVEAKTVAMVQGKPIGSKDQVKAGEVICYQTEVKNVGSEEANGVKVIGEVPEGTTLVEPRPKFEYDGIYYYQELADTQKEFTKEKLLPGESVVYQYEVRVKQELAESKTVTNECQLQFGEVKQIITTLTHQIVPANMRVTIKRVTDRSIVMGPTTGVKYFAIVENLGDTEVEGVNLSFPVPDGLTVGETAILVGIEDEKVEDEIQETVVPYADPIPLGTIPAQGNKVVYFIFTASGVEEIEKTISYAATVTQGGETYRSNFLTETAYSYQVTADMTSETAGKTLSAGDIVRYHITIQNQGKLSMPVMRLQDSIPMSFTIRSVKVNGEDENWGEGNDITLMISLEPEEQAVVEIEAVVDESESRTKAETVTNQAFVYYQQTEVAKTQMITNLVEGNGLTPDPDDPNDPDDPDNPNKEKYIISGMAWIDENKNGQKDANELPYIGLTAYLLNGTTGQIVKDDQGREIKTQTDETGQYVFEQLLSGRYMVAFAYSSSRYRLTEYQKEGIPSTENSNVIQKNLAFTGEQKIYGVTDYLTIAQDHIANINIGVIPLQKFDFALEKTVDKITVTTAKGVKQYAYEGATLAKVEIDRKTISQANLSIDYLITITNQGEVEGTVQKIEDILPEGISFDQKVNPTWYQTDTGIATTSLAGVIIKPGESKTVTVHATKQINGTNLDTITNVAKLQDLMDTSGRTTQTDLTEGQTVYQNDEGKAEIIVSVKTGLAKTISIITIIALLIGLAIWLTIRVNKKRTQE